MAQQHFIFDGNAGNFAELVRANSDKGPVLVHFWAPYAGPSFKLYGVLEEVAKAMSGRFLLVNVNVEKEKALAQEFSIASVPINNPARIRNTHSRRRCSSATLNSGRPFHLCCSVGNGEWCMT